MQALWINKFDFNGNTAAIITWAEGVLQTGWRLHLVLTGVPPFLLPLYQKYLAKTGLKSSLNINRQQIQNLLFYSSFELLHVFHPDLYHMAAELSRSFQVPWIASYLSGEDHPGLTCVHEADTVTCSHSDAFQTLQRFFNPYRKTPLHLIPPGVKTGPPPDFSPPQQWAFFMPARWKTASLPLFSPKRGYPEPGFLDLRCFLQAKPPLQRQFSPWTPAFSKIIKRL